MGHCWMSDRLDTAITHVVDVIPEAPLFVVYFLAGLSNCLVIGGVSLWEETGFHQLIMRDHDARLGPGEKILLYAPPAGLVCGCIC